MALWYDCGNGWVKTRGLARRDLGADVYLCCPGPSLAEVEAPLLNGPGRAVFAVTTAYPAVHPDVWVGTDVPECYDRRLWAEPFVKVVRGSHRDKTCQGRLLRSYPNVLFADVENAPVTEILRRRNHDAVFVWNRNTFTTALHLAVWMGARRVFLVGCDFGGSRDYHDGRGLSDDQRSGNRRLYANLVDDLKRLAPLAAEAGVEIASCTPDSPVNAFLPFLDLTEALARSGATAPRADVPCLHADDAERCQWPDAPSHGRGVVLGVTERDEANVPAWLDLLGEREDLSVAFADLGMSASCRERCAANGDVIDVADVPTTNVGHRQPFAVLQAPFQEILWVDAGLEPTVDLGRLLSACSGTDLAAGSPGDWSPDDGNTATRLLWVRHGHPVVTEWAVEVLAPSDGERAVGDAFARALAHGNYECRSIPVQRTVRDRTDGLAGRRRMESSSGGTEDRAEASRRPPPAPSPFAGGSRPRLGWSRVRVDGLGVMVPVCESQEDLVGWWWWAYARHNRWPVVFADFGMSADARRWCEARGRIVAPRAPGAIDGWFRKPFALLQSPFRHTTWFDLDCEIRDDVSRLSDLCEARLALGRDWSYPAALRKRLPFEGPCWCTAVVAVEHGNPLVVKWAETSVETHGGFRGDQEILSSLLNDGRRRHVSEIPDGLVRSRQEGETDGLVAMHWSGPGGKSAIRRAWSAIRAGADADMRSFYRRDWRCASPKTERGILVGIDDRQEWMLPWWWSCYEAHNDLPVLFVDFGMSARARDWCAERGMLCGPTAADCYGWFKKPLALLESPFRQAIWLDADCEVRARLDALFEYAAEGGIGLALDRGTPQRYRDTMPVDTPTYNSGLIVFNHGDAAVPQWASMTMALRSDRPGDTRYGQPGDQETLALTLRRHAAGRLREIPMEVMRLRLSDGDGACLVMHWTGREGKAYIRQRLDETGAKGQAACRA